MKGFTLLLKRGGVLSALLLWFALPLCAQQIVTAIHVQWDNDLTDSQPVRCVTSGEVANPCFYFLVAYKFPIISVTIDWAQLQEITQAHSTQPIRQTSFSIQSGLHSGCTQPPVSDPQNWSLRSCGMFPTMGTQLHNSPYRVTVQYRYLAIVGYNPMPIYQTFGPYQTSVEFSVRNLVVSSADEVKVLKWDPDRPEVCDTSFQYTLDSAQTRDVPVKISIYSTDGSKVFEVTEQKRCALTHSFTWNGRNSLGEPAPPGLYVFDVEVNPNAGSSGDTDRLRSSRISVGEHEIVPEAINWFTAKYLLYSQRDASSAWVEVYSPNLERIAGPVCGAIHAVPPDVPASPNDWCTLSLKVSMNYASPEPYRFVFWTCDAFSDQYKSHKNKASLANQSYFFLGWFMGFGFHFSRGNFTSGLPPLPRELDCSALPSQIAEIVYTVVARQLTTGKLRAVLGYRDRIWWWPNRNWRSLLFTTPIGADTFVQEINDISTGSHARFTGIVYYAGHGWHGRIIGIPDANPDSKELFGISVSGVTPDATPSELRDLSKVRVFYLSACETCTNASGEGLVAAIASRGAWAVIGLHVPLVGLKMPPGKDADLEFFRALAGSKGSLVGWGAYEAKTVGEALEAAWHYLPAKKPGKGQTWRDYYGVSGCASDPLKVTLK